MNHFCGHKILTGAVSAVALLLGSTNVLADS